MNALLSIGFTLRARIGDIFNLPEYRSIDAKSIYRVGPDMSIPKVSIAQVKAARALLGWSQEKLAAASGISIPTVKRLEAADGTLGGRPETGEKLRTALEDHGIEFLDENGGGPGVRLKKARKTQER